MHPQVPAADATPRRPRPGSFLHAPSPHRSVRHRHRRRSAGHRLGLGDHRPQRQRRLPEGGAERPGARQLQRAWQALERARLGRAQRGAADPGQQAGRSSSSTTRAARAPTRRTSGRHSRTRAARTTAPSSSGSSPAARRRTAPTGRSSPGSGCCRTTVSRPPRSSPSGSCGCRTSAATPVADGQPELGVQEVPPHLRARSPTSAPVHGFKSTSAGVPWTRSAATSMSTRSTRPTARAGCARTAS